MAYTDQTAYLKIANINRIKPSIISFGSSRVMQFRKPFFTKSFYNGGGLTQSVIEYNKAINLIEPDALPEIMIVGFDWCQFNPNFSGYMQNVYYENYPKSKIDIDFKRILTNEWNDYKNGKWNTINSLKNRSLNKGFNGYFNNVGYRKDGSYYYGDSIYFRETSMRLQDTIQRVRNKNIRFEQGEKCGEEALQEIESFFENCKSKGVEVVGFTGPFAPTVLKLMKEDTEDYAYVWELPKRMEEMHNKYGFEFYDYTDIGFLGCDDTYFVDGFHAGEIAHLLILQDMVLKGSQLEKYVDVDSLDMMYEKRYSNLQLKSGY